MLWTPSEPRVSVQDSESLICNSGSLLRSKVSNLFCWEISLCQEIMSYYDLSLYYAETDLDFYSYIFLVENEPV